MTNSRLRDVLGSSKTIQSIKPALVANSCVVDIELSLLAGEDDREDIILRMSSAGYRLRGEELNTLTFLKEID